MRTGSRVFLAVLLAIGALGALLPLGKFAEACAKFK